MFQFSGCIVNSWKDRQQCKWSYDKATKWYTNTERLGTKSKFGRFGKLDCFSKVVNVDKNVNHNWIVEGVIFSVHDRNISIKLVFPISRKYCFFISIYKLFLWMFALFQSFKRAPSAIQMKACDLRIMPSV